MDRITNWCCTLEQQIAHRAWPEETSGAFYLDVSQLADEAASNGDQPHAIAAVLLYQQLVEEVLYIVDYWCYFEKVLALYPTVYEYDAGDRVLFGQLISRIQQQQAFPRKEELLTNARKLNSECRIPAAHKLLHNETLPKIQQLAQQSKELYGIIMECFGEIRDHFRRSYDRLAERTGIPPVS